MPSAPASRNALHRSIRIPNLLHMRITPFIVVFLSLAINASADFATEMIDATFKLFDPAVTGTSFLVRRDAPDTAYYLVTANHMLKGTKADNVTLVLRERLGDGTFKRRDHSIPIRRDGKRLWVRHEKDDVAVLRLADPLPVPVGAIPIAALADEAALKASRLNVASPIFVLTYPKAFEASEAGFPVTRQGIIASYPFLPFAKKHSFLADFTAFGGDSGGPVFVAGAEGHPMIIGMVFAQFRHDEQIKSEYEERSIHYPLGLGDVLHAHYVRETIELAARPGPASTPETTSSDK